MGAELDPTAPAPLPRTRVPLRLEEVALAAGMAAIALITGANVVTRYLTDISLAFTEEYSVLIMVLVTLIGAGYGAARGHHIRIGFLVDRLPEPQRRRANAAAEALLLLTFALLAAYGSRLAWDDWRFEILTPGLGHPQWLYTACLPVLSLAVIGRGAGRLVRLWRGEAA